MYVDNATGTSKYRSQKQSPKNVVNSHVKYDGKWCIVPLCRKCNAKDEEFRVKKTKSLIFTDPKDISRLRLYDRKSS